MNARSIPPRGGPRRPRLAALVAVLGLALAASACGSTTVARDQGDDPEPAADLPVPTAVPAADGPVIGVGMVMDPGVSGGPELCLGPVAESYPPQCEGIPMQDWTWHGVSGFDRVGRLRFGSYAVAGTFDGTTLTVTRRPITAALYDPMPTVDPRGGLVTRCPEPAGGWTVTDPARATESALQEALGVAAGLEGYAGAYVDPWSLPEVRTDPDSGAPPDATDPAGMILNVLVTSGEEDARAAVEQVWGGALCVSRADHTQDELQEIADELTALPGMVSSSTEPDRVVVDVLHDDGSLQEYVDARYGAGLVLVVSALTPVTSDMPLRSDGASDSGS